MSTMSRTRLDGSGSQHKEDSFGFEGSHINMSQSSTSSSSRSSQDAHLHCSESMPSSTPSDESQQSQDGGCSLYKKSSPQLENIKCEKTEMNGNNNGSHQSEVSELSIPVEKDPLPSAAGRRSKSPRQKINTSSSENGEIAGRMQTQTLAAHSNLSRLAEIATCRPTATPVLQTQDVNQPPRVLTTQQMNLVQSQLLASQTRYLTPGQNISLPVGLIQQNHFPYYGGYQQIPGGMFQHLGAVPMPQGHYPPPFAKGSIIQLTSGDLKRVEELTTEDFVQSTKLCPDLKLETGTVVLVNENIEGGIAMVTFSVDSSKQQVTVNCPVEHPFFVYGQGWSSCRPEQSQARYTLHCQPLKVGDICIFLSPATAALLSSNVTVISQGAPAMADALSGPPNSSMPVTVSSGVTGATPSVGTASSDGQTRSEIASTSTESQSVAHAMESAQPHQTHGSSPQGTHINTTLNSQAVPLTGNVATQISHYQALPASFLGGTIHPHSLVHGAIVPQSGVGNGLLMTAIGIVPSGGVVPLTQQGTIYGNQATVETLPKQASNGIHTVVPQEDGKLLVGSEDGQSELKRQRVEGDGK